MRTLRSAGVAIGVALISVGVVAACGDDDNAVNPKAEAGADVATPPPVDGGGDAPVSTCGITIPTTYESPDYATNAAQEIALRSAFDAFLKPMKDAENVFAEAGTPQPITKAQLEALYTAGAPNVKGITTAFYQGRVNGWLTDYEAAFTAGPYVPADPPPASGGVYGKWVFNARGVDLRQAMEKGIYTAGFYNHAVQVLTSGAITEATIDRLVAAFGAHPSFQNNQNAATNKDVNSASYAARRTPKTGTGPYLTIKAALIKAKASAAAGDKCNKDRDDALKVFFAEWEKTNYATVIFYFSDIATKLQGATPDYAAILHGWGEAIGFIAGYRTTPQAQRIITDAQIDALASKSYAPEGQPVEGYKLQTSSLEAIGRLTAAIGDIKTVYAFTDADVQSFKTNY